LNRIYYLQKFESVEISIASADSTDAVLPHENGCVRVVHEIAGDVRQFRKDLFSDLGVSLRGNENTKPGRGHERSYKFPRIRYAPGPAEHSWVGGNAEKFVQYRPSRVPSI
jgi:hypothetical protein